MAVIGQTKVDQTLQHAESAKNQMKTVGNHGKVRLSQNPEPFRGDAKDFSG